ncbi:MAG TPA: protocatechuate 3,4-dioxygenase subunit alpha [Terriglobia bacterium]
MTALTPSQTVGPFFHLGFAPLNRENLAATGMAGEAITIQGRVLDGNGAGVDDAVIEIWQPDSEGRYSQPEDTPGESNFKGFRRIPTDSTGAFRFTTTKPGRVPGPDGELQAPHLMVTVLARGLLKQLTTRIYLPAEPSNQTDAVLSLVPPERRSTLIAKNIAGAGDLLEWNVILQGVSETVFFDV